MTYALPVWEDLFAENDMIGSKGSFWCGMMYRSKALPGDDGG